MATPWKHRVASNSLSSTRIGACVAGWPEYSPTQTELGHLAIDAYGTWSMQVPATGRARPCHLVYVMLARI